MIKGEFYNIHTPHNSMKGNGDYAYSLTTKPLKSVTEGHQVEVRSTLVR